MTDAQMLTLLREGRTLEYGLESSNAEVIKFMNELEERGLILTGACSNRKESKRWAMWIDHPEADRRMYQQGLKLPPRDFD
tara:strand:- start:1124 stop:1366 length:243 start_codon:yes stop_codon:yes gene_type:complete